MSIIEGRNAEILQSIIDGTPYENPNPYPSRIEQLLMELKEVIEQGGGGATVDQTYSPTSENAQSGKAVAQAVSTKVDKVTGKGLSENDFTNADKAKLDGIETGAEANVQADWTQTDTTADDYIKNKPTIPAAVTVDQVYDGTSANPQSGVAINSVIGNINTVLEEVL